MVHLILRSMVTGIFLFENGVLLPFEQESEYGNEM